MNCYNEVTGVLNKAEGKPNIESVLDRLFCSFVLHCNAGVLVLCSDNL